MNGRTLTMHKRFWSCLLVVFCLMTIPMLVQAGTWSSGGPYVGNVVSIAVSPNYVSDQTLFAGTDNDGVYKSTDGGTNWSAINTGLGNPLILNEKLNVLSVAVSPNYASDQTLFVVIGENGVYKSTNGGTNWSAINTGLGNLDVLSVAVSPNYASDQTLFAGTLGNGVYISTDGGTNWSAINTDLGIISVLSLAVSPHYASDQTLFAGTYGNGVYISHDPERRVPRVRRDRGRGIGGGRNELFLHEHPGKPHHHGNLCGKSVKLLVC